MEPADVLLFPQLMELGWGEGYTEVSRTLGGLLVKCCVSNSNNSVQVF